QANPWVGIRNALEFRGGPITRTVIYDHDFDFAFVVCGEQSPQSFRDFFSFVVSGNHYTDRLREICSRSAFKLISEPDDNQRTDYHEGSRHDHEGPEEFLDAVVNSKSGSAHQTGK